MEGSCDAPDDFEAPVIKIVKVDQLEVNGAERTKYRQNLRPDGDCAAQSRVSGEPPHALRTDQVLGNSEPDSVLAYTSWCNCISTALYDLASAGVEPLSRVDPTPRTNARLVRICDRIEIAWPRGRARSVRGPIPFALLAHGQGHAPQTPHTSVMNLSQCIRNRMAGVSGKAGDALPLGYVRPLRWALATCGSDLGSAGASTT